MHTFLFCAHRHGTGGAPDILVESVRWVEPGCRGGRPGRIYVRGCLGCSPGRGPRANRPSTSSCVSASTPLAASRRSPAPLAESSSQGLAVWPSPPPLALSGRRSWTRESWALPRWPRSLQALAGLPPVVDARRLAVSSRRSSSRCLRPLRSPSPVST
jgi:hypothetical protein